MEEDKILPGFEDSIKGSLINKQNGVVYNQGSSLRSVDTEIGNQYEDFNKYDAGLLVDMNQNANRAYNQGALKTLGNSFVQLGTETLAEGAKTIGYMGSLLGGDDYGEMNGFAEFFIKDLGENISNFGKDLAPVYTNNDSILDPFNHEWLAKTVVNLGPTLGMMLGSMGTMGLLSKGLSAVAKRGIMKSAQKAARAGIMGTEISAGGLTELVMSAGVSRNAESASAAMQLYDETIQKQKQLYPDKSDEEIKQIASNAADDLYSKSMSLFVVDLLQYNALLKAVKLDNVTDVISDALGNKIAKGVFKTLVAAGQPLSEGVEEGIQFSFQQQVEDGLYSPLGKQDLPTTFINSMANKEFQESFVQGFIGGGIFQAVGWATNKLSDAQKQKTILKQSTQESVQKELGEPTPPELDETPDNADQLQPNNAQDDFAELLDEVPAPPLPDAEELIPDAPIEQDAEQLTPDPPIEERLPVAPDPPLAEELQAPDAPIEVDQVPDADYLEPVTTTPNTVDADAELQAEALTNQEAVNTVNELTGANIEVVSSKEEAYQEALNNKSDEISLKVSETRDRLKRDHGKLADLAHAVIQKNSIKANKNLTKEQKQEMVKPHQDLINKHKEKGESLTSKNILNYRKHREVIGEQVQNEMYQRNIKDLPKTPGQKKLSELSDSALANLYKEDMAQESKDLLIQELQSRKNTPDNQRLLQKLTQAPLSEETKEEMGIDVETQIGKLIEQIATNLGTSMNIVKGRQGYDYTTNTLSIPQNNPLFREIEIVEAFVIGMSSAPGYDKIKTKAEKQLKEAGIKQSFPQALERMLTDVEYAKMLYNTPAPQEKLNVFQEIVKAIAELLGITQPNMFESLTSALEQLAFKEETKLKVNTHPNIPKGKITNIVSPYGMATYDKATNTITHGFKKEYEIKGKSKRYIEVNNEKLYLQPGFNQLDQQVSFLLTEDDQLITKSNIYSTKDVFQMRQANIPFNTELELKVSDPNNTKDSNLIRVELMYQGKMVGILPGWFADKPNDALKQMRKEIYERYVNNKEQGTVTFLDDFSPIVRSNEKYEYSAVVPTNQKDTFEIGVITRLTEDMAEQLNAKIREQNIKARRKNKLAKTKPEVQPGDNIIQFSNTKFEPYTGDLTTDASSEGNVVLMINNPRGVRTPIPGDTQLVGKSPQIKQQFFQMFMQYSGEELQEKLRDLVRWTAATPNGRRQNYPIISSNTVLHYGKKKATEAKVGDYIILPDANYNKFLNKESQFNDNRYTTYVIKDNNVLVEVDPVTLEESEMYIEYQTLDNYYMHPASQYYNYNNVQGKPVQLDRNKMNQRTYLESKSQYMKFQVIPGVFAIPERKIKMELNTGKESVIDQAQDIAPPTTNEQLNNIKPEEDYATSDTEELDEFNETVMPEQENKQYSKKAISNVRSRLRKNTDTKKKIEERDDKGLLDCPKP